MSGVKESIVASTSTCATANGSEGSRKAETNFNMLQGCSVVKPQRTHSDSMSCLTQCVYSIYSIFNQFVSKFQMPKIATCQLSSHIGKLPPTPGFLSSGLEYDPRWKTVAFWWQIISNHTAVHCKIHMGVSKNRGKTTK